MNMVNSMQVNAHKFKDIVRKGLFRKYNKSYKKKLTSVFEYHDVHYSTDGNMQHRFDVYVPASTGERMFPILVYFHGGDYMTGDKAYTASVARKLASTGMVVFSCNYSLAPKYTLSQIEVDVVMAIEEAMTIAELYHGDYNAVIVGGEGVGAGLVGRTVANMLADKHDGYLAQYILGTIGIAGRYDLSKMKDSHHKIESGVVDMLVPAEDKIENYDSNKYVTAKYPHTLLICGNKDKYEADTTEFAAVLKKKKVKHSVVSLDTVAGEKTTDAICGKDAKVYNTVLLAIKDYLKEILG